MPPYIKRHTLALIVLLNAIPVVFILFSYFRLSDKKLKSTAFVGHFRAFLFFGLNQNINPAPVSLLCEDPWGVISLG